MKSDHSNGFRFQAGNKKGKTFDFELSCYHCYNQVAELNYVFLILQKNMHTDIIFWVPVLLFLSIHYSCITEKGSFPYIYILIFNNKKITKFTVGEDFEPFQH